MFITTVPYAAARKPSGRSHIVRLSAIALIIYGHGKATGDALAVKFGVTLRTIYRDITRLRELGFPIVSVSGPRGGFTLDYSSGPEGGVSPERYLLDIFARTGLMPAEKTTLESVIGLASDSLAKHDLQTLQKVNKRILFDPEEWYGRDRPSPNFESLQEAVLNDRQIRISFTERTGRDIFEDTFDPYGLVWKGGFWYVYGYSHRENRKRRLRIQRLIRIIKTEDTFVRPKGFNLLKDWRDNLEAFGKGDTHVILRIFQEAISEFENFNWKRDNKIIKARDHWLVKMDVDSFEWLIPLILSYAGDVQAMAPLELKHKIIEAAQTTIAVHSGLRRIRSAANRHPDDTRSRATIHRIELK